MKILKKRLHHRRFPVNTYFEEHLRPADLRTAQRL